MIKPLLLEPVSVSVVPGQGEGGIDGGSVALQAGGEGVQEEQVGRTGPSDPGTQPPGFPRCGGKQCGEVADLGGQGGHLRAGGGQFVAQLNLVLLEVGGIGEQEAGGAARGKDGMVGFDAALGDVADEEVALPV